VGAEMVVPLTNLMNEALFIVPYMHIGETPLQVLRSGKAVGAEHYIVVRAGGPPGRRIIPLMTWDSPMAQMASDVPD
jgi:hypothetical protein